MKTLREYIELINEADGIKNPWPAGTPHAQAWDTMSPEDKKWLGGADPTDQYILARAPNKGKPVAPLAPAPVAAPTPVAEPTAVATPVPDPVKNEPKPLPPVTPAPTPAKPQQAARPAGPNPVLTLQNKLIGLGAKIKADGIMGPQTQAAMKEYGLDANGNPVKNAKTGQPVTNDKTANAIIQRGGVDPKEITKDMTVAQQVRSDLEAQRANTMTPTGAPTYKRPDGQEVYKTQSGKEVAVGSLTDKRNQRQAEYQAQNQAFLAQQAAKKAGTTPPATAPATAPAAAPAQATVGNVPPRPANRAQASAWARQYAQTHNPDGTPISESTSYNELDRIVSLVHYR